MGLLDADESVAVANRRERRAQTIAGANIIADAGAESSAGQ
jgi:hypothetical protein